MYAYKTNSADYLDYLASQMSREEILADPDKCFLLQNEYIKDNMELAFRWQEAKLGSYEDKYNFVEYLVCNGTELDADTILHYRAKCATDPVYMDIGYGFFSDGETIKQIRKEKYNKESDDCFTNPCMYLGRFSAIMGSIGDTKATYSPFNIISDWCNSCSYEEKAIAMYGKQLQQGMISQKTYDAKIDEARAKDQEVALKGYGDVVAPSGQKIPEGQDAASKIPACGNGRPCFEQAIIPSVVKGWNMLMGQIFENNAEFTKSLLKCKNCCLDAMKTGDWMSPAISEMLDLTSKANVKRYLGDCSRLWSQVRRLRLFGSENDYKPVSIDMLAPTTNVNGSAKSTTETPTPTVTQMSQVLNTNYEAVSDGSGVIKTDENLSITLFKANGVYKVIIGNIDDGLAYEEMIVPEKVDPIQFYEDKRQELIESNNGLDNYEEYEVPAWDDQMINENAWGDSEYEVNATGK